MTSDANNDADLEETHLDDADLDLDEAFDALLTEVDDPSDGPGAAPSNVPGLRLGLMRPGVSDSPNVQEVALQSMLPARGLTQPGWDATSPQPPRASVAHARQTPSDGTTTAQASTHGAAIFCPTCKGPVDVRSRHVAVHGGAVRVYCSAACLDLRDALPAEAQTVAIAMPPKRRRTWWFAALVVPAGLAAGYMLRSAGDDELVPPAPAPAVAATHPTEPDPGMPADPEAEADARLVDELSRDAWIHPLAGPARRMPRNHNGAFGASRPGDRPPECVSGHCGVDLGYVWGEPVYAVHGGVIDFVNRGPNEEAGGVFVRIAHRGGTLFSWYFHLAAVPKTIRPGVKVSAGELLGLVGDTGIKHSSPHLHFALSVKTSKHVHERYLDPEPLIAIWPLWIPDADGKGGRVSTAEEPGVPVRASGGGRKRSKVRSTTPAVESSTAETKPAETKPAETNDTAPGQGAVN